MCNYFECPGNPDNPVQAHPQFVVFRSKWICFSVVVISVRCCLCATELTLSSTIATLLIAWINVSFLSVYRTKLSHNIDNTLLTQPQKHDSVVVVVVAVALPLWLWHWKTTALKPGPLSRPSPPPENPKSQTPNSPDTLLKITTETKWQTKDKSGRKTKLCFK